MTKQFLRAYTMRGKEPGQAGDPIKFLASTAGIKRDGRDLDQGLWSLDNFRKNPVFLWSHDYRGQFLPIGKADVEAAEDGLETTVLFDQADEFARKVEDKYRRGFLNAVSVGWNDVVRCANCDGLLDMWLTYGLAYYRKKCPHCERELTEDGVRVSYDLLDISGVNVPGDPDALMERELRALEALREAGTAEAEALWSEIAAEMVVIFRAGVEEADEVRLKRYRALLPRYRRLGKTPPEFLSNEELAGLGEEELRGLFLEGEIEITSRERAGAVLNKRNRDDLAQAASLIQGVLERAQKEEEADEASEEDERSGASDGDRAVLEYFKNRLGGMS